MGTVSAKIASLASAIENCAMSGNTEWYAKHLKALGSIIKNHLPSGSGFDRGTSFVSGSAKRIVLSTAFHHMDNVGSYDGWTEHNVTIRPTFDSLDISVSGRDRNGIKDFIVDTFYAALTAEYKE